MTGSSLTRHQGGCHCGAVRYEVDIDAATGTMCNCTVCTKINSVGAIARPAAFTLVSGADSLSTYEWGGKTAQRKFCKHCGVHCFAFGHLDVLGGDYVAIHLNTLDDFDLSKAKLSYWDGRNNNWQGGQRPTPWPITA
ncbi:MAG: GFA family protein [Deltaproteobacteria bacterium]|nr:MAG: GFA family protein [Deltaproteobacteria bacterium]TMQ12265.1 MAG: GFA family protein [Deltaproteobacteria bacterium]